MTRHLPRCVAPLALALCLAPLAHAERLPAKLFAQNPGFSAVALSPDGQHLALTTPIENRTDVLIVDLQGKAEPMRIGYRANEHVVAPYWADDERLVLSKAEKAGSRAAPRGTGEIYSVDASGKNQELLFGYIPDEGNIRGRRKDTGFASLLDRIPGSKGGLLFAFFDPSNADRHSAIYKVDAHSGKREQIEQIPMRAGVVAVDRNQRPRFALSRNDDAKPEMIYRPTADADWRPVPKALAGNVMTVLAFERDNNIAWAEISDAGEASSLYRVDFGKGSREKVYGRADMDVGSVLYGGFDGVPFAILYEEGKPAVQYLDPKSEWAQLHAGLMKTFPGNLVRFVDFSRDDRKVLAYVYSDRNPGDHYLVDRNTQKVSKLQSRLQGIDPSQMASMSPFRYAASDGQELDAFLTIPKEGSKPFPVVVLPHGGPHGPFDSWGFDTDVQFLANRGYAVLQVNFRGSGGRGEDFEKSGYRKWGTRIMDDIVDGLRHVAGQGLVDAGRACIFGASFGGYSALMAPVRSPGTFRCAIGYVGVYDLNLLHTKGDSNDTRQGRNIVTQYVSEDQAELDANSPAKQASRVGIPVFLVAGKDDIRAPVAHTDAMAKALKQAGTPVEVMIKAGEAHGFYDEKNRIELYDRLEAFLDQHIGKKAQ
ncbi:MAG: S9 family peptidase [Xanthomonadales bacterium]|nr:S9 family peptidase [Xanthomonadales bacterium]MBK7145274.1 S9 family peptidase [Xanthomonadales bacterium]MCC6562803.1 S9 family peptidase [Xanthomonadales bacterium]